MVECDLAKVEVAGSNPVSRSNIETLRGGLNVQTVGIEATPQPARSRAGPQRPAPLTGRLSQRAPCLSVTRGES